MMPRPNYALDQLSADDNDVADLVLRPSSQQMRSAGSSQHRTAEHLEAIVGEDNLPAPTQIQLFNGSLMKQPQSANGRTNFGRLAL